MCEGLPSAPRCSGPGLRVVSRIKRLRHRNVCVRPGLLPATETAPEPREALSRSTRCPLLSGAVGSAAVTARLLRPAPAALLGDRLRWSLATAERCRGLSCLAAAGGFADTSVQV